MSKEWLLIYQARRSSWLILGLFEIALGIFIAIISLGGLFAGLGLLFGFIPISMESATPAWKIYGSVALQLLFTAWLARNGLQDTWDNLRAIIAHPQTFEGILEERTLEKRSGVRVNYFMWVLKLAGQSWEISKHDVERTFFSTHLTVGRQIRIQYRQGTRQITHLWARPN